MRPNDWLRNLQRNLPRLEQRILNEVIAVEATKQWEQSFRQQGFTDQGFTAWPARANQMSPESQGRALLVKTGRLKRVALKGRIAANAVRYVFPEAYMRIHNEGGTITQTPTAKQRRFFWAMHRRTGNDMWKRAALATTITITIPKRQFIGESRQLITRLNTKCQKLITNFLR